MKKNNQPPSGETGQLTELAKRGIHVPPATDAELLAYLGSIDGNGKAVYSSGVQDLTNKLVARCIHDTQRIDRLEAELGEGDSWKWIRGKFEKCRTQFKWYEPRTDSLRGTRYEVMGWLHVLFAHADPKVYIDITMEHQKLADDAIERAERAEALVESMRSNLPASPEKGSELK